MNIDQIENCLVDISNIFSNIILNTNYSVKKDQNKISWKNYHPGFKKNEVYALEYQNLIDKKQYSFLLYDNSFIQFFYEWKKDNILKARLAYYPVPLKIGNALEDLRISAEESGIDLLDDLYFGFEYWQEKGIDIVNTSHLRIDYDPIVKSHSKCHLQVGALNEIRIDSENLTNPFSFFDWIVSNIFRDFHKEIKITSQHKIKSKNNGIIFKKIQENTDNNIFIKSHDMN